MVGRVLVGGGTGFVGQKLCALLEQNGYLVTIISRRAGKKTITWDDISSGGLPLGTTSVVNLAGENILNPAKRWNDSFKDAVYQSRIKTTSLLSQAIDQCSQKPRAFVAISGVGIYPPSETAEYTEESPVKEFDFLSKLAHDWEAAAQRKTSDECRLVSLRSGVVIGKGGMCGNLYIPFFFGVGGHIGSGKQFLPWIHIDDLTNLIMFSIENNVKGILNGVAPAKTTNSDFTKAFAKALSRPAIFPLPEFVVNLMFGKERGLILTQGQHVIPKRVMENGFKFKYTDITSACRALTN